MSMACVWCVGACVREGQQVGTCVFWRRVLVHVSVGQQYLCVVGFGQSDVVFSDCCALFFLGGGDGGGVAERAACPCLPCGCPGWSPPLRALLGVCVCAVNRDSPPEVVAERDDPHTCAPCACACCGCRLRMATGVRRAGRILRAAAATDPLQGTGWLRARNAAPRPLDGSACLHTCAVRVRMHARECYVRVHACACESAHDYVSACVWRGVCVYVQAQLRLAPVPRPA